MASLMNLTLTIILILGISTAEGKNSKYSKDANLVTRKNPGKVDKTKMEAKNPFRMQKFNTFWEKVKSASHLKGDERTQLYVELANHDEGEIQLKHLRVN